MAKLIEIDMNQLAAFCRMKPTLADCSAFFNYSEDTVERRIKEDSGMTFTEFRDQNMTETRFGLIRRAIQKAETGDNTMLMFCLKNLCGWSDRQNDNSKNGTTCADKYRDLTDEELQERIDDLTEELIDV